MQRIVNRPFGLGCGLLLLGVALGGCSGPRAPELSFTDASGVKRSLADFRGRVVVLGFCNSWSEPSQQAAPYMQQLHERFADRGVRVVAVSAWERSDPVAYMQEHGYTYGLLLNGTEIARQYEVVRVPTFYVIGATGRVIFHHEGFDEDTPTQMAAVIERHLAKQARNAKRHQTVAQHSDDTPAR